MQVDEVRELTSAKYFATLLDENKQPIALADLTTLTVTIYDLDGHAKSIINSRNAVDVKNANGGTYPATSGEFVLDLSAADNTMVDTTKQRERHAILLRWTYNGGAKAGWYESILEVIGSPKVGA